MLSCNDGIKFRIRLMALILAPIAILLGVRLYFVQVVDHEEMIAKAKRIYTTVKETRGKRGEIYDCDGNLLVSNVPCENITADPSLVKDDMQRQSIARLLSLLLNAPYQEFYDKLAPEQPMRDAQGKELRNPDGTVRMRAMRYVVIERNVPIATAASIRNNMRLRRIKALFFEENYMRFYPKNQLLSNILGFTNTDDRNVVAVLGLERFFNDEIAAKSGKTRYEHSRDGRELDYGNSVSQESRDGANIYLTISEPIQSIMEEELDAAFEKWKPKAIYAVLADPKTGNVLAIAQRPTFNPNNRRHITPEAWRTRIIEDAMEPGSIMKPFSIAVAVDDGTVNPGTRFDCENGLWYYLGKPLRDSHKYGIMSVADIIKTSSNIGTAKIALVLGEKRVYEAITRFGFGSKTGLPLKPESVGIVPPVRRWDGLSITRFPIGYAIMVSPVQMVRAYCALANHGLLPKMRLIDRVSNPETGKIHTVPIEPPAMMFRRPETCGEMVEMMVRVTGEGGTARRAAIPGYRVAGKTGTSRKFVKGRGYIPKYFASFVGFVPAEKPAFVMLVTMDEPSGGSYGGTVSGPVFRAIGERVLKYMQIAPDPALMTPKEREAYEKANGVSLLNEVAAAIPPSAEPARPPAPPMAIPSSMLDAPLIPPPAATAPAPVSAPNPASVDTTAPVAMPVPPAPRVPRVPRVTRRPAPARPQRPALPAPRRKPDTNKSNSTGFPSFDEWNRNQR